MRSRQQELRQVAALMWLSAVAVMMNDGQIVPAGSRRLWPYGCAPVEPAR